MSKILSTLLLFFSFNVLGTLASPVQAGPISAVNLNELMLNKETELAAFTYVIAVADMAYKTSFCPRENIPVDDLFNLVKEFFNARTKELKAADRVSAHLLVSWVLSTAFPCGQEKK